MSGPAPALALPLERAPSGRVIAALAAAAFAAAATMRVADPLIPQIAADLDATVGAAAIVSTAFSLAYGICQLAWGPLGDRLGKFKMITVATFATGLLVAAPALAGDIEGLGLMRALGGAFAAAIIPMSMAFIGDHVAYEGRQAVLARFLTGQIIGVIAGQALGGVLGDLLGWRAVFVLLGLVFLAVGGWLLLEMRGSGLPEPRLAPARGPGRLAAAYVELLRRPWVPVVLVAVFVEAAAFYGGLAFLGAFAHERFGLSYAAVGLVLACFGLGGILYAVSAGFLVRRLGEPALAAGGGVAMALGFALAASAQATFLLPPAMILLGIGFYLLHGTLQTNATQMAPEARGFAVATFAACLFLGQAIGVFLLGGLVDRVGYRPCFLLAALVLAAAGLGFAQRLRRRRAGHG